VTSVTEEMRTKEHAHDYRYFPDPDLMPSAPDDGWIADVKSRLVELPLTRKQRLMRDYQLPSGDAEVFKSNVELGNYLRSRQAGEESQRVSPIGSSTIFRPN
jgi:aspartyl-tRNA(Asn)/glutamyl-tRNA(Gln) amidotransferase subunit B